MISFEKIISSLEWLSGCNTDLQKKNKTPWYLGIFNILWKLGCFSSAGTPFSSNGKKENWDGPKTVHQKAYTTVTWAFVGRTPSLGCSILTCHWVEVGVGWAGFWPGRQKGALLRPPSGGRGLPGKEAHGLEEGILLWEASLQSTGLVRLVIACLPISGVKRTRGALLWVLRTW